MQIHGHKDGWTDRQADSAILLKTFVCECGCVMMISVSDMVESIMGKSVTSILFFSSKCYH